MLGNVRPCLVCDGNTAVESVWPASALKSAYAAKVGRPFPEDSDCCDYTMLRCMRCGLVFADPCTTGDPPFYRWITGMDNYYKVHRWEWDQTATLASAVGATSLLDVGCGSGVFLDYIRKKLPIDVMGIDTLPDSVEHCRRRGHKAVCMTLEDYLLVPDHRQFDLVTSFHCLEHVSDPRSLVASMARALAPNGRLAISVPCSPPSWEVLGPDCLNMPPHHVTRWTVKALKALADSCGLHATVATDLGVFGVAFPKSIYWHFRATVGLPVESGALTVGREALRHPGALWRCANYAWSRERVGGARAGDTAYAMFTRDD